MNLSHELENFISSFRDLREDGQPIEPMVKEVFNDLVDKGNITGLEILLRWSMGELINYHSKNDVQVMFPALVDAMADIHPRLTESKINTLSGKLSMGLLLCSNSTISAVDAIGGSGAVIPILKRLPESMLIPVRTYASQDVLGLTGTSSARTAGVVLIDDWIKEDASVAKDISVDGLLRRLGEKPLQDDPQNSHMSAIKNVATVGLDMWLTNQSRFKLTLQKAKYPRYGIYVVSTGMASLTLHYGWSVEKLSCLEDKRAARRLEKILRLSLSHRPSTKLWYPQEEIAAIHAYVRRKALANYASPHTAAAPCGRQPRI